MGAYPFFFAICGNLDLKRAWNFAFLTHQIQIFWPVLRTPANASPKRAACSLRLSPENLPRPKWSNFVVQYNIGLVHDKVRIFLYFWWFILNVFWLIFKNFWSKSIDSGKKELILNFRFKHNFNKLYSPKIHLSNKYVSHCQFYINQIARFQFQFLKISSFPEGHIPLRHSLCAPANHSLMSKSYYINWFKFAAKLVLKMKEKLCQERCFWVLKTLKTQELPAALPLDPRRGVASGPHQGPLSGHWTIRRYDATLASLYLDTNYFYSAPRSNKSCTRLCNVIKRSKMDPFDCIYYQVSELLGLCPLHGPRLCLKGGQWTPRRSLCSNIF